MGKSNCFEIVFLRWIANTAACSSKQGVVRDFPLIGARRDIDNRKLEICFLEHNHKLLMRYHKICYLQFYHQVVFQTHTNVEYSNQI